MNITFLIGNGFDIGLHMPTRYENFYEKYCVIAEDDNENIRSFKKMLQERNNEETKRIIDWADFEKAFGEHSMSPEFINKRDYLERFEDFVTKFNAYLEVVESCTDYSNTKLIADTMNSAMKTYFQIRKADETAIRNIYNQSPGNRVYNFISFNYTKSIDICVDALRQLLKGDSARKVGSIVHIHGYIDENMIVGVNDPTQILNPSFANDADVVNEIVKPEQNSIGRTAYENATIPLINNSDIICIYGMSIGETDKKWWELIAEWLSKGSKRVLVILIHENKYDKRFSFMQQRFIQPIIDKFLSFSNLTDDVKAQLESRIYVGVNNDVFAMNLFDNERFEIVMDAEGDLNTVLSELLGID